MNTIFHVVGWFIFIYPLVMIIIWICGMMLYNSKIQKYLEDDYQDNQLEEQKFIIICSVFNEEKELKQNILANSNMKYSNYEIWYIDDKSTDGTVQVMESLSLERVKFFYEDQNHGKATVLNKYVELVDEKYVIVIDSDTILDSEVLSNLNSTIKKFPNYAAYNGDIEVLSANSLIGNLQKMEYKLLINAIKKAQFYYGNTILTVSGAFTCFETMLLKENKFNPKAAAEDIDYSWRINLKGHNIMYASNLKAYIQTPGDIVTLIQQRKRWSIGLLNALENKFIFNLRYQNYIFLLEIFFSSIWGITFVLYNLMLIPVILLPQQQIVISYKLFYATGVLLIISYLTHKLISRDRKHKVNVFLILQYSILYFWIQPISFSLGIIDRIFSKKTGKWRNKEQLWKQYLLESTIDIYALILYPVLILQIVNSLVPLGYFLIIAYAIYIKIYFSSNLFYTKKIRWYYKLTAYISILLVVESFIMKSNSADLFKVFDF